MTIRIGTRGSKLARWQADWAAEQLRALGHDVEIKIITTRGDVSTESLKVVGGQGLFTKEIQRELLSGHVDVAVHSLKDLPTESIEQLVLGAVPERETTADCLVSRDNLSFEQLPAGAKVGTGSLRRGAQLLNWRSDICIEDIRGNVDSRLSKLHAGQYDAILLAAAGLKRLELAHHISETLPEERILPAIGQGALGLECRVNDQTTRDALAGLDHPDTHAAITAERSFLASLLAGCLAPVAAIGRIQDGSLTLQGRVITADGTRVVAGQVQGAPTTAVDLGSQLAEKLKSEGAMQIIADAKNPQ